MGVFTTTAKTWGAEPLKSSDLNAQVRDFINGFGTWTSWTPALTNAVTNPSLGTGGTATGAYLQIGKLVIARGTITFGTSPSLGTNSSMTVSLPVTASSSHQAGMSLGTWAGTFTSAMSGNVLYSNSTLVYFNYQKTASALNGQNVIAYLGSGSTAPTSGDKFGFSISYEAA